MVAAEVRTGGREERLRVTEKRKRRETSVLQLQKLRGPITGGPCMFANRYICIISSTRTCYARDSKSNCDKRVTPSPVLVLLLLLLLPPPQLLLLLLFLLMIILLCVRETRCVPPSRESKLLPPPRPHPDCYPMLRVVFHRIRFYRVTRSNDPLVHHHFVYISIV
jgi:hypothetical protein